MQNNSIPVQRARQLEEKKHYQIYTIEEMLALVQYNKSFMDSHIGDWWNFGRVMHNLRLEAERRLNNESASLSQTNILNLRELVEYVNAINANRVETFLVQLALSVQQNSTQSELLLMLQDPLAYINTLDDKGHRLSSDHSEAQ